MAGSVIGAVAGGLASAAGSKLLGGGKNSNIPATTATRSIMSVDTKTPAFRFTTRQGDPHFVQIDRLDPVIDALAGIRSAGLQNVAGINDLLGQVQPGFGRLTDARVQAVRDAASRTTSDLRENLSRRRVLGSSFGQDTVARAENEFAKAEGEVRAQSFLEELDTTFRLLNQRFTTLSAIAKEELSQANFEATTAVNLINGTQQIFDNNAQVLGDMAIANAAGIGRFIEPAANAIGNKAGDVFGDVFGGIFGGGGPIIGNNGMIAGGI